MLLVGDGRELERERWDFVGLTLNSGRHLIAASRTFNSVWDREESVVVVAGVSSEEVSLSMVIVGIGGQVS